jgi:hypothetical protein
MVMKNYGMIGEMKNMRGGKMIIPTVAIFDEDDRWEGIDKWWRK